MNVVCMAAGIGVAVSAFLNFRFLACYSKEWEALMVRFCSILGIRTIIEQPVNSRFFRHPDMADP